MKLRRKYPNKSNTWVTFCKKWGISTDAVVKATYVNQRHVDVFGEAWNLDSFHVIPTKEDLQKAFG